MSTMECLGILKKVTSWLGQKQQRELVVTEYPYMIGTCAHQFEQHLDHTWLYSNVHLFGHLLILWNSLKTCLRKLRGCLEGCCHISLQYICVGIHRVLDLLLQSQMQRSPIMSVAFATRCWVHSHARRNTIAYSFLLRSRSFLRIFGKGKPQSCQILSSSSKLKWLCDMLRQKPFLALVNTPGQYPATSSINALSVKRKGPFAIKLATAQALGPHNMQYTIYNEQYTTHTSQHAINNTQHNTIHERHTAQHTIRNTQYNNKQYKTLYTIYYTQYTINNLPRTTQYVIHNTKHIMDNTQYTAHNTQFIIHNNTKYTTHNAGGPRLGPLDIFLNYLVLFVHYLTRCASIWHYLAFCGHYVALCCIFLRLCDTTLYCLDTMWHYVVTILYYFTLLPNISQYVTTLWAPSQLCWTISCYFTFWIRIMD